MSKTDKDGWIRHRGGKQPLPDDVLTQVILRKESKKQFDDKPFIASAWAWSHCNCGDDVMYYREYKPAEKVEACSKPELQIKLPDGYGEIYNAQAVEHSPLQWRDRITELDFLKGGIDDAYQSRCADIAEERAELVQKLASEGFALIGRVVEPVEDMSDWRNWKEGDLLEMVKAGDWEEMTNGKLYEFAAPENRENFAVVDDNGELRSFHIGSDDFVSGDFKWHSRPSA